MGKIKEILINTFDRGMSNDPRSSDFRKFYHTKHFDTFTYPHKLVPRFTTSEEVGTIGTDYTTLRFIYDADDNGDYKLWLLVRSGAGKAALFKYNEDTDTWDVPVGNLFDTISVKEDVFINYKGYAYVFDGSRYLMRYKLDESAGTDETYADFTAFTEVSQPVHFTKDDILYLPVDNKIYKKDDTDAPALALTLPDTGFVVGICEYGDYLAIAFNYTNEIKSVIFLWDRNDSVVTTSKRWELPSSKIYQIANLNGRLMVVDTDFIKVTARRYNGSEFEKLQELSSVRKSFLEDQMSKFNMIVDDKLYFPMDYDAPSENTRLGIWALDSNGRLALDFMVKDATTYKGLFYLQGNFWICYNTTKVAKSGITFSTTLPSIYEALFFKGATKDEYNEDKEIIKVGVITEKMPTAGQIVLKYRTKEDEAWTTIFTHTTDDSQYHESVNIEADGSLIPQFKELQFRVESTGGAVVTGLVIKYELIDSNLS